MDSGLALMITVFYTIGVINSISLYLSETSSRQAADEEIMVAKAAGSFIQNNLSELLIRVPDHASCTIPDTPQDTGNNWTTYNLDWMPMTPSGSNGFTCGSMISQGLIPSIPYTTDNYGRNILHNRYGQNYFVAMRVLTTAANASDDQHSQIEAIIYTSGGQQLGDASLGSMVNRMGPAGMMVPNSVPPGYSAGQGVPYGRQSTGISANFLLPGHTAVSVNTLMDNEVDDSLHRDSDPGDTAPNRLAASLYMANADAADSTQPVNVNMNGKPAIYSATANATAAASYAASVAAGATPSAAPHNGMFGARQIDSQTLTGGNSVANKYATNAAQSSAETSAGQTVNDTAANANTGTNAGATADGNTTINTVLANANFDVTEGYRLTSADGLHVTASNTTIAKDGNYSGDVGANDHASATYSTGAAAVPGTTWDKIQSGGQIGLMAYLSSDPTGGYTVNTEGESQSPATAVIATYNSQTGSGRTPVGFEADGGMRAPVYYDSRNMTYLVDPSGVSDMGDLSLSQSSRTDTQNGSQVFGRLWTNGLSGTPYPTGWGGGVMAYDVFSAGGTIASGCAQKSTGNRCTSPSAGGTQTNASLDANGDITSTHRVSSNFFVPSYNQAVQNTACLNQPMSFSDKQAGGETSTQTIPAGTIATDSTGKTMYCSATTGTWQYPTAPNFTNMYNTTHQTGIVYTNTQSTTLFIGTYCQETPSANGFISRVFATITNTAGVTNTVASEVREGGSDANTNDISYVAFMVPPGGRFFYTETFGQTGASAVSFCQSEVWY